MTIVDELTYRSYAYNREASPDTTPEELEVRFSGIAVDQMEERFQEGKSDE